MGAWIQLTRLTELRTAGGGRGSARSFGQLATATDPFTTWFLERTKAIHGVDLSVPTTEPLSELVVD